MTYQFFEEQKSYPQHLRVVLLDRTTTSHSVKLPRFQNSLRNTFQMETDKLDNLGEYTHTHTHTHTQTRKEYTNGSKLPSIQAPHPPFPQDTTIFPFTNIASFTLSSFPETFQNGKNM